MKIILCKGQFLGPISGADEAIVTYAIQLKKAGHDPHVLTMYAHPSDVQYQVPLAEAGVKVIHITDHPAHFLLAKARKAACRLLHISSRPRQVLHRDAENITRRIANLYLRECHKYLSRSHADVVHVVTPDAATPVLINASHAAGVPVIYQEMGTPYYSAEHGPYYERLIKALPLCAEVAALSPGLADLCRERYKPQSPVSVLPIMVEDLRNGDAKQQQAPSGPVTFGFAARFDEMKGLSILLRAFARMNKKVPASDSYLKLAGTGPQASEVEKQVVSLGIAERCHVPGAYINRAQKRAFFKSLDVLVHPSLAEGTPNSIVEAMSFGLPVIASAVGGVPEVVSEEAGILIPAGDENALADAMHRLASDVELRARMGLAARARYEQLFTPDIVLPIMLNTYDRVGRKDDRATTTLAETAATGGPPFSLHPWMQAEHAK
ncbi:MAG: glycosyltransferase family 4 protein [Pyrinomonadaceae bacterium]|nr:glycosyltransferase family 4 protein [Pyrinomonadaceae bacterium]